MKNLFVKHIMSALAAVSAAGAAYADAPAVTARVEPDSIMIGDRFTYTIEVDKDIVQSIAFPEFDADPKGDIELVESLPVDTLERDGRRVKLRKRYVLAAFAEGRIGLGTASILYADKNITDTLRSSEELFLDVGTFQIDSTSHSIFDLKPQKTLKFKFREISGYLLWSLLAAVLLAAVIYGLMRWLSARGKSLATIFKPAPPLPPHVTAIKALEELRNRKLWQNNRHKEYYSGLSDILRTYISGRYGIGAMEMTTDEIVEAIRGIEMPKKSSIDLATVLRDADLAKFAKFEPDAGENEAAYDKAYYFVEETKEAEPTEGDEDEIIDNLTKKENA